MASKDGFITIKGKNYPLDKRIGGGFEGSVYAFKVKDKHGRDVEMAAKIINTEKMTNARRNEIYSHLQWLRDFCVFNYEVKKYMAAPCALLDDELGYVMEYADNHDLLSKYIQPPETDFDSWYTSQEYNLKKRYQIIVNLFAALRDIHLAGLVFTDLSPNNIMISKDKNELVFIDTDNMRRRTDPYSGVLGTPGYMAPEILRKIPNYGNSVDSSLLSNCGRISPDTDIFSAAVIAFQILTLQHPFIGDEIDNGPAEGETKALNIETDYIFKKGTSNTSTYALTNYFDEITTEEIQKLFYRTFVDGKENPHLRPTDEEFLAAFQKGLDLIMECPSCHYQRLYHAGCETKCINCGMPLYNKVLAVISYKFIKTNVADIINSIGDYPDYNISLDSLCDENGNPPSDSIEVSRILLKPGRENRKFLYTHHFEEGASKDEQCALLILSGSLRDISLFILSPEFKNAYLVNKRTHSISYLKEASTQDGILTGGKSFPLDDYFVIFETQKRGNGSIELFVSFERPKLCS